ncbi:VWA domain-containing protein [Rufibacter hautae]|uniref:VWA domain-containing protein n=1 Tax=Rufibacter hautae TaxID=2595005 RepID=A0A5B6TFD3_9BACT|nr:VWA domain-containing protein [Rufibacter hautae]KAA3437990.1 VWA domain-containing protein [Rufibacter hautae]
MWQAPADFSWLNLNWFSWRTWQSFDWANQGYLYALLLVPLLFLLRWLFTVRFRRKMDVALFEGNVTWHWTSLLRYLPDVVFGLFLMLVLVALARPQKTDETVELSSEGIDIVLVMDVSGSMELTDFLPNRLEAAKEVALQFVNGRVQDRIGLVVFAGRAFSLAPLTTDYELVRESIRSIKLGMVSEDGTAIGSALAVAINRLRESKAKSKVCILISDGENTAGSLDPELAAQLAHAFQLKLYTVGIGKEGTVQMEADSTGKMVTIQTGLEEKTLRQLASLAEGQFFRAQDAGALTEIFQRINRLEKTEIKETRYRDTRDYYQIYLRWAIVLLLLWLLLKNTFFTNALED